MASPVIRVHAPRQSYPPITSAIGNARPFLVFNIIPKFSTCAPATFFWGYSGPDLPLSLSIISTDVPQNSTSVPSPSTTTRPAQQIEDNPPAKRAPGDSITFASSLDPTLKSYTWQQTSVPQGWYILRARITSSIDPSSSELYATESANFFISNSGDTSCLSASSSTPASSSTDTNPGPAGPTGTTGTLPVSGVGSSSTNTGAIAGGVVGGVVVLALVLLAFIWLRCGRRRRSSSAHAGLGAPDSATGKKGWGGLSSLDSNARISPFPQSRSGFAAAGTGSRRSRQKKDRHHSNTTDTSSVGPMVPRSAATSPGPDGTEEGGDFITTNINSDKIGDIYQAHLPSLEKFSVSPSPIPGAKSPFADPSREDVGAVPSMRVNSPPPAPSPSLPYGHGHATATTVRRPSVSTTMTSGSFESATTYPPSSPTHAAYTSTAPTTGISAITASATGYTSPPSMEPARSVGPQRKTPRKPVPAYQSKDGDSPTTTSSSSHPSPITPVATSMASSYSQSSASASSHMQSRARGHYTTMNASWVDIHTRGSAEGAPPGAGAGVLNHKTSYPGMGPGEAGARPVHYLIPDMPSAEMR